MATRMATRIVLQPQRLLWSFALLGRWRHKVASDKRKSGSGQLGAASAVSTGPTCCASFGSNIFKRSNGSGLRAATASRVGTSSSSSLFSSSSSRLRKTLVAPGKSTRSGHAFKRIATTSAIVPSTRRRGEPRVATVPISPDPLAIPRSLFTNRFLNSFSQHKGGSGGKGEGGGGGWRGKSKMKTPSLRQVGLWLAGAATAAVGVQVGAQMLEVLDHLPFFADLEVLVGTGVAVKFLATLVNGGEGRARIEARLNGMVDALKGTDSIAEATLQKDIQKIVEESSPSVLGASSSSSAAAAAGVDEIVAVKKQSLVNRLVEMTVGREQAARAASLALQAEVSANRKMRRQLADVNESLQSRKQASLKASQQLTQLQALTDTLKSDRARAISHLSLLKDEVGSLAARLEAVSKDKEAVRSTNQELASKLLTVSTEKQSLAASLAAVQEDGQRQVADAHRRMQLLTGQLREKEALLQQQTEQGVAERTILATRLETMKFDRDDALSRLVVFESQLAAAEARLGEVGATRDELFGSNKELKQRLEAMMSENRGLTDRVVTLETEAREAAAAFKQREAELLQQVQGKDQLRTKEAGRAAAELADVKSKLEADLHSAESDRLRYSSSVAWLEGQLAEAKKGGEEAVEGLKASLEFAEGREREEHARVLALRLQLHEQTKQATEHRAKMQGEVASLESQLSSSQSELSLVERALALAKSAANRVAASSDVPSSSTAAASSDASPLLSSLSTLPSLTVPSTAPAKISPAPAAAAPAAPAPAPAAAPAAAAVSKSAGKVDRKQQQQQQVATVAATAASPSPAAAAAADVDSEMGLQSNTPMIAAELSAYARALFPAYVDLRAHATEQNRGVNALVADLVCKGAQEQWARQHVAEALLKPAVTGTAAAAAAGTSNGSAAAGGKKASLSELSAYAHAIRHAYVDSSVPISEQRAGTEMLVEELVLMGGEESWARTFVKQSLDGKQATEGERVTGRKVGVQV